jgi:signal transduction histidine kinase
MFTNENQVFLSLIIISLLLVSLLGFMLFVMMRQYRHYSVTQRLGNRTRLQELERERRLIAADLHDEIGPILSATRYALFEIEPNTTRHQQLLNDARDYLFRIHERVRSMTTQMVPSGIEEMGPLYAIDEFRDYYKASYPLEIDIITVEFRGLTAEQSLHLFRMLQEIMNNAIKHSGAKKLVISGEQQGKRVVIRAADDGKGFDLESAKKTPGVGLENLEIRADIIGAELLIETAPGEGTSYTINVPVSQ